MKEKRSRVKENEAETEMKSEKLGRMGAKIIMPSPCLENTAESTEARRPQNLLKPQTKQGTG